MRLIYNGVRHKLSDLVAADQILKLKERSGSNPWPVIERILEVWSERHPDKWESYLVYLKEIKDTRKVTSVGGSLWRGVSKGDKDNNAITVYAMDIPQPIMFMIRAVYNTSELPMNKEFFAEFGRHFPRFKILEKR